MDNNLAGGNTQGGMALEIANDDYQLSRLRRTGALVIFTQYYLECLSQASYLIADPTTNQAIVVDPRRDIEDYLADADARGLTIVGAIMTHFHADFVSGHLEMAESLGCWIGYGEQAKADFDFRPLRDGERIELGEVVLEIMHTPGHTPESISVLVYERGDDAAPWGVLTGDCLFIGEVGRPDLLASTGISASELAGKLYDSIRRLMELPDQVRVFPAHGAGSHCGKNLSEERQSTIGDQRLENYACQPMSQQEFIDLVTEGQSLPPNYFGFNAKFNKQVRAIRQPDVAAPQLSGPEVAAEIAAGSVLVDTRSPEEYAAGAIPGSINVGADGRMAEAVGMVLQPDDRIVILAPDDSGDQCCMRLMRIGYDQVAGHVAGPQDYLAALAGELVVPQRLSVAQFDRQRTAEGVQLVDIRNPEELRGGMMPGAQSIPLPKLTERFRELDPDRPVLVHCSGGWRSSVAASWLRRQGFADVADLIGGFDAWAQEHQLVEMR